jgi:hypothetical protein
LDVRAVTAKKCLWQNIFSIFDKGDEAFLFRAIDVALAQSENNGTEGTP